MVDTPGTTDIHNFISLSNCYYYLNLIMSVKEFNVIAVIYPKKGKADRVWTFPAIAAPSP